MSKTILCVLLKVLMSARADILSNYPDSDFIQDIPEFENNDCPFLQNLTYDTSHSDSMSVRNKVDKIPFANMSVIQEHTKKNILSKPTCPRAFVEFYNRFQNEEDISVTFRWNQPEFTDEVIQRYTVQCWSVIENQKEIQICDDKNISATILECTVHNLKPNTTYYFQVRAHTKVGAGPYTDLIDVSTTHENPIPQLFIVTGNGINIWDLDSKINVNLVNDNTVVDFTYSIAEHKIYWGNRKMDLMMLEMNENRITKIAKLQFIARDLCIDWVARNLYWTAFDGNESYYIMKLDLTMLGNGIVKYDKILKSNNYLRININIPSTGTSYWKKYTEKHETQMMQSDLDGKNVQIFQKNLFICPFTVDMSHLICMKIDDINTKKPLIYWLLDNLLIVTDFDVSMCNLILRAEKIDFKSLAIDKTNIYIKYNNDYLYVLKKKYALLESVDAFKYIQKIRAPFSFYGFDAFGKSLQSYPSTRCLTPDKKVYNELMYTVTTNSIIVNLPKPIPKSGCKKYNLPTTLYTISISYCLDNELNKFDNFTVQTYERYYKIQNLMPFTEYKLLLVTSNFYFDQLSMDPLFGSEVILRTKPSKLDAPEDVIVQTLTPTIAAVYWMPPKKLNCAPVIYKIYWTLISNSTREVSESLVINTIEHKVDSKFFTIIEPLIPGKRYRVYVRIYPVNFSKLYTDSLSKTLYMYSELNDIILRGVSTNGMNISWIPSVNLTIHYVLEYKNVEMQEWQIAKNFEPNNGEKVMYYIKNLLPRTRYEFRLILRYPKYEKDFTWPSDGRFTFSTLTSDISSTPKILIMQYYLPITLSLVVIVTVICVCCFYLYRERKKSNEQILPPIMTDIELETLHEIPNVPNVQLNLYSPMLEYNSDKYALTKIKREEIKLEKLLDRGEFVKVFQGKVKNLKRPDAEISAAIKMLRENASSQDKEKFLEEAKLMNRFRHKHVLRLLAVCLDGKDSPLIVLELMEIDLLQYLRDSQKLQPSNSHALRLQDLFAMCEDVARGCCYLEDLRVVHRNLACHSCLVSAKDRENRVVKIGDFSLARDVSKNDYCRLVEMDCFPLRWMAPESLVIGKFTSQSDVWSFGVLMWEITSLGEQPYTGKINEEVIDYIRAGDKLPMPLNCPPTLYELMLRCWNPANDRPNFKFCLENIIALRNNIEDTLLSPVDII